MGQRRLQTLSPKHFNHLKGLQVVGMLESLFKISLTEDFMRFNTVD